MKNIIKTFVACCVFVLGMVRLDAATATGQSGNCTVNTCDFVVTAEADPYGILLRWNFTESGFKAKITRNDKWFALSTVSASEGFYRDKTADYMKWYEYTVEITGGSDSQKLTATANCVRGTGMAPKVEKVEAAQLWLDSEGPYNVKVTLNQVYDINRYEVTRIGFSSKDVKDVKWYKYNSNGIYNIYDNFKTKKRGPIEIIAQCEYRERTTRELIPPKKGENEAKTIATVFFHKYEGSTPNWFEYWKDDKAVPRLGDFKYKSSMEGGVYHKHARMESVATLGTYKTVDGVWRYYPPINKWSLIKNTPEFEMGHDCAAIWRSLPRSGVGQDAFGVSVCAVVCAHEFEHKETAKDLYSGRYADIVPMTMTQADVDALALTEKDAACPQYVKKYYEELCNFLRDRNANPSKLCIDVDNDGVRDAREYNLGLTVGETDTKHIHNEQGWDWERRQKYELGGDDEYLSRKAEKEYKKYVNASKDWAFPGSNIASGEKYESMDKSTWNKKDNRDKLKKELSSSFGATKTSKAALFTRQLLSDTLSLSEEEVESLCERIEALPDLSLDNLTKDVEIVDVKPGTANGIAGAYSQLSFEIQISTKEDVTNNVALTGWLVDSDAHPVAKAQLHIASLNGAKTVVLNFAGSDIYIKRGQGYALKYLTLASDVVNGEQDIFDARVDAATSDRTYEAIEFAPSSGYMMSFGAIQENKLDDLAILVPVEICSNGVYELSAVLKTEEGEFVAEAFTTNITQLGQQEVCLTFSRKDIFLSKHNGPYVLRKVELRTEDGECVDSRWDAYTTAAYSYRDFADGSETIFADAASFRRNADLVGADGLCDALNFSFVVTNLAPSEAEYVARIYLCGTNDELVCSSTRNVVLSNEVNDMAIAFRGLEIKKREVEGPYYVREVTIEDAESGETVERFKPQQILIDRRLDEFGSSPVAMNGEVTLSEATEGSPFAVEVPVQAIRSGTVTVSAVLVATNGTPVTYVEASRDFAAGETGSLALRFSDNEITTSGVRGPYYIKYIAVRSGYEGLDEVQIDDPDLGMLNRQFTLYVDCAKEDDSGDGLTPATAKATIRGALAVAQPGDFILVADGVYEPFACYMGDITIRSVNGPEKTIIDGEGQLQCAYFESSYWEEVYNEEEGYWDYVVHVITGGAIEGFTLRNGWVENRGGGIYGGTARRCIIIGNRAKYGGGGACRSVLDNCIVCGNYAGEHGGGAYISKVYNCTIAENTAALGCGGVYASSVFNSIVWGNKDGYGDTANYGDEEYEDYDAYDEETGEYPILRTEFHASCTYPMPDEGDGNIDDNPLLADAGHGDVRLRSNSPCIDAGVAEFVSSPTDVFGAVRIQGEAPEIGAVENNFEDRISVSATVCGIGTVSPVSAFAEEGGAIVFTATETGREFLRFETNGVYATSEKTFEIHNVQKGLEVVAVFKPGALYVRKDGSDDNDGLRWSSAKATIQGAIDDSAQGDVIYVNEGVYSPFDSNNRSITIRGVYGAERTIIDAGGVGACTYMGGYMDAETNTCLVGFTLRNGYVLMRGAGASGGTLIDCRVENNRCHLEGGGLYRSVAKRCAIVGNCVEYGADIGLGDYEWSGMGGGGAFGCILENCLVVSNSVCSCPTGWVYGGGTRNCSLYSCTVADNFICIEDPDGDAWLSGGGIYGGNAYNTICWGNTITGIVSNVEGIYNYDKTKLWMDEDPLFAGVGQYTFLPESPCIDAGVDKYVRGDKDIAGNTRICGDRVDIGAYEYAEEPEKASYMVHFDANGGTGELSSIEVAYGLTTNLPANTYFFQGYSFEGWSESPDGEVVYKDMDRIANLTESREIALYAIWMPLPAPTTYIVTYDSDKHGIGVRQTDTKTQDVVLLLKGAIFTRTGYSQTGWAMSDGGAKSYDLGAAYTENAAATLYPFWTVDKYTVTFDANGGDGGTSLTLDYGVPLAAPTVTRTGYTFTGWSPAVPATVPADDIMFVAQWEKNLPELHDDEAVESPAPSDAASEYNGYLYDEKSSVITGTIQVKIGKPAKKDGMATIKATVVIGTRKVTLKGADKGKAEIEKDGPTWIELVGGEACEIALGSEGLSGYYGTYDISGSRNFFTSKDKSEASAAAKSIEKRVGAYVVMWDGGTASITIDKKGKAKASVTLSNGAKGTATSSLLVGDEWHCVPVMVTKKMNVAFTLWLSADGSEALVSGLGDDTTVGKTGPLKSGAKFHFDAADGLWTKVSANAYTGYLPNGVSVIQNGAKWTLPKAGKLTMKKGVLDTSKAGDNPSGLKLSPKKDGTFTGSFKVYYAENGKLKSKTANVTGIVINGVGYGTATIKGVGSVAVTIE